MVWTNGTGWAQLIPNNNQSGQQDRFFGFQNNFGLSIRTNDITRMWFNNASGLNAGYIGIGQNFTNPQAPLHVVGGGSFTQGGKKAITISNKGSLTFLKDGSGADNDFLMAAPSSSPNGDLYFGVVSSINNPSAPVFYSQSIVGQNSPQDLGLPGSMTLVYTKFSTLGSGSTALL